jgi:hypothetical protein
MSIKITGNIDPEAVEKLTPFTPLNAHDRCDRCGAQSYVRWVLGDSDLVMCNHHSNKYEPELLGAGFSIHEDARGLLTQRLVAAY